MTESTFQNNKRQGNQAETITQRKGGIALKDNRGRVSKSRALPDLRTTQLEQNPSPNPNHTGLPKQLKSGIETLSGMNMGHVKVHYNSSAPAQLNAHAYAQGGEIHVAPGQEKHLPHEAWHLVQQAQGRVKPTMQMKAGVPINDDAGLEHEADVMGGRAAKQGAVQLQSSENIGSLRSVLPSSFQLASKTQTTQCLTAEHEAADRGLSAINKSPPGKKQFNYIVGEHIKNRESEISELEKSMEGRAPTTDEQTQLEYLKYRHSELVRNQSKGRGAVRYDKTLKAVTDPLDQQMILDNVPADPKAISLWNVFHPFGKGKAIRPNLNMIHKANGMNFGAIKEFVHNQQTYQNWLAKELPKQKIMDANRSSGFEFEFATYKSKETLAPHTEIAESSIFSPLFNIPFILETDTGNELEIGMPPFLFTNIDNKPDKSNVGTVWLKLRTQMKNIRDQNCNEKVTDLIGALGSAGLGADWTPKDIAEKMWVKQIREKHDEADDKVYSQLNISLTPEEIAEQTENKGKQNHKSYDHEHFADAYGEIKNILDPLVTTSQSKNAVINFSKGIANFAAVPSILLLTQKRNEQGKKSVYSTVKETFGTWVKDSVPNIVDSTLTTPEARAEFKKALAKAKKQIRAVMNQIADKALVHVNEDNDNDVLGGFEWKKIMIREVAAAMSVIGTRLKTNAPSYEDNEKEEFAQESYTRTGKGVRRDTFVNIPMGEKTRLHLAEIRNDSHLEKFLK